MASFGLGHIAHEISIAGASPDWPRVVADWEATETAPGGYESASGKVEASRVLARPDLYRQGARWLSYLAETGECIFAGYLLNPAISGGVAQLAARGLGFLPDRQAGRLMYQSRFYGDWVTADSDPYALTNGVFNYDSSGGKLGITLQKATTYNINTNGGWVFGNPSGIYVSGVAATPQNLGRVAFTMRGTDANFEWRLYVYTFPNTLIGQEPTTYVCNNGTAVDAVLTLAGDVVWLRLHCLATNTPAADEILGVYGLRINGIAMGGGDTSPSYDVFTAGQVVRDIAGRLGLDTSMIDDLPQSILPLDSKQGTWASPMDYVDALTDQRWLVLNFNGQRDVMDHGSWTKRTWTITDPEAPVDLLPAEQFDAVYVPFAYPSGSSSGFSLVRYADAFGQPSPLPQENIFSDISLLDPFPDETTAQVFGQSVLGWLSKKRFAGSARLTEVKDSKDFRRSAHTVRAGDTIYTVEGIPMRIKSLSRRADGVTLTFDDRMAAVDSLIARRNESLMLTGLFG